MALVIVNKGTLDDELGEIALMGASTKRGDKNTIGQFGTGNKYAIAYLLRNGFDVKIVTGGNDILITAEPVKVRGVDFDVVCFNGKRTGYTTELGYNWTLWQAIRELYANALDEGLVMFDMVYDIQYDNLDKEQTYFIIQETDELQDFWLNRSNYFLMDETPIFKTIFGEIYPKKGKLARVFNNGIKVYETDKESLFDYNFYDLQLTEDRIVKHRWDVVEHIHKILATCDIPTIIRAVLNGLKDGFIESEMDSLFDLHDYQDAWGVEIAKQPIFSKEFAGWLSAKEQLKTYLVPSKIYNRLINQFGNKAKPSSMQFSDTGLPYVDVDINDVRAKVLADAGDFFVDAGFVFDYKIRIVDFKKKNILGSIDKEKDLILVSVLALDRGVDMVINTIIEEYIHLKHGVADETRGFQDAVITEFINYMKGKL